MILIDFKVIAGFGKRPSFKAFFSQSKEAGGFKK